LKKLMLMAAVLAMVLVAAIPAIAAANGNNDNNNNDNNHHNNRHDNNNGNNNNGGNGTEISQSNEQGVESGDSSQTFTVTGGGDNSNACQGIQGVSNTGNLNNNTGVLQYASDKGGVEVGNGDFTISPSSSTTCDQKVNQAASASGS
jgi:hypothetical protein